MAPLAPAVALPVLAALLAEVFFYLLPGFRNLREGFFQPSFRSAWLLMASDVLPWALLSLPTGTARLSSFLLLAGIAAAVSFWYLLLPRKRLFDILFLAFLAAVVLQRLFDRIYLPPVPKLPVAVLGHLMLIRTGVIAILCFRGDIKAEFRFLPEVREWLTGIGYFVLALPIVGLTYWKLGLFQLRAHPLGIPLAIATFAGFLWVVALSEEFFFRGLLQQWLERWTGNGIFALLAASLLFGCVHLGFRFHGNFPNWRFATVAAIAGFFYGLAWRHSRSVQASMVTHALTITLWRVFLT